MSCEVKNVPTNVDGHIQVRYSSLKTEENIYKAINQICQINCEVKNIPTNVDIYIQLSATLLKKMKKLFTEKH